MNRTAADLLVVEAVRRLSADARRPWPPPTDTAFAPIPLDEFIRTYNLVHIEITGLNCSAAYGELLRRNVHRPELKDDAAPLAGFLFANARGGLILVRRDDPLPRRRFTAAHELGHYLLHFLPLLEGAGAREAHIVQADGDETVSEEGPQADSDGPTLPEMERQANRFAAELLMPEGVCRSLVAHNERRYGATPRFLEHQLAGDLLVSREAARWRLHGLGLTR